MTADPHFGPTLDGSTHQAAPEAVAVAARAVGVYLTSDQAQAIAAAALAGAATNTAHTTGRVTRQMWPAFHHQMKLRAELELARYLLDERLIPVELPRETVTYHRSGYYATDGHTEVPEHHDWDYAEITLTVRTRPGDPA